MNPVQKPYIQMRLGKVTRPKLIKNPHIIPSDNTEIPFSGTLVQIPKTYRCQTLSRKKQVNHVTILNYQPALFTIEVTNDNTVHQREYPNIVLYP